MYGSLVLMKIHNLKPIFQIMLNMLSKDLKRPPLLSLFFLICLQRRKFLFRTMNSKTNHFWLVYIACWMDFLNIIRFIGNDCFFTILLYLWTFINEYENYAENLFWLTGRQDYVHPELSWWPSWLIAKS